MLLLVVLIAQCKLFLWAFDLQTDIQMLLCHSWPWDFFPTSNYGDSPSFSASLPPFSLPKFKRLVGGRLEAQRDFRPQILLEPCQWHFRLKNLLSCVNHGHSAVNECQFSCLPFSYFLGFQNKWLPIDSASFFFKQILVSDNNVYGYF